MTEDYFNTVTLCFQRTFKDTEKCLWVLGEKSNVQTYVCDILDFIKKSTQMTRRKCAQL